MNDLSDILSTTCQIIEIKWCYEEEEATWYPHQKCVLYTQWDVINNIRTTVTVVAQVAGKNITLSWINCSWALLK